MRLANITVAAVLIGLTACTHDVQLSPSLMPAGEVMANRIIQTPTLYSFSPDLMNAKIAMTFEGMGCSAHTYNVALGSAITDTLKAATDAGFSHAQEGQPQTRAPYNIRFDLEDVEARLNLISGFWSTKIGARVELSGKVDVTDGSGAEVARAIITGEASDSAPGGCADGDKAIHLAGEKAIRRLGTDYVYKIINTNALH